MSDRLEAALKRARQAYMDATLVTRSERRQAAGVTGGSCQRPIPGTTIYDDAYACNTWETARPALSPALHLPPQPPEEYTVDWKVTLDEDLCWRATASDFTQGPLDKPPMRGCLRR
jgi:hypothetical protein